MRVRAGKLKEDVFVRPNGANPQLPVAAGMAADQRHAGKTLREFRQIHRSRFGGQVAATGQPGSAADFQPCVDIDMHIQFAASFIIASLLGWLPGTPFFPVPGYLFPIQGPLRIHFSILAQLSSGKPGSMGVRPESRSLSRSKILKISSSTGYGANGSSSVPPTS